MHNHPLRPLMRSIPARGFTLMELLITVVIAAILAAVLYPSFINQVRKSRRSDAIQALAQVQQAQERWRANKTTYGSQSDIGISASAGGFYTIVVTPNAATPGSVYVATATAVAGKSQAADTGCTTLTMTVSNGNASYGTNSNCWSK